ncbi:MAG: helix-turn-helix transcriptional regulator, partial [Candidatus Hodarchaeota archaeon]
MLKKYEELQDALREAILNPNKEFSLSKSEYEDFQALFTDINNGWVNFKEKRISKVLKNFKSWESSSRRGFFRLLVIFSIFLLKREHTRKGKEFTPKGIGGLIKKKLENKSNGVIKVRAGSLYKALNELEGSELIRNYKDSSKKTGELMLSKKGKWILIQVLEYLVKFYDGLKTMNLFSKVNQSTLDDVFGILREKENRKPSNIKMENIASRIDKLHEFISNINNNDDFKDFGLDKDKTMLNNWKTNFNRGMVDVFILGNLFLKPCYGNELISAASESLKFQAGTLYPRIKKFLGDGLIEKMSDKDSQET